MLKAIIPAISNSARVRAQFHLSTNCFPCLHPSHRWWASSSDMLIYPSIVAFPSLSLHRQSTTTHLRSDTTALVLAWQLHSLHWTDLVYLMDIWLTIHMYLLLFLVSPMCPLLRSDQSRVLTPHGQALSITSHYGHFLVFHLYLTCLYLPFEKNIITEAPTNCLYESPPELRFSTYASHHLALISHYFVLKNCRYWRPN